MAKDKKKTYDVAQHGPFTQIANKILETLATLRLSGRDRRVLDVILRQTYGYAKKDWWLSARFIAKATGIGCGHVNDSLKKLENLNIIYRRCYRNGNDLVLPKREHPVTESVTPKNRAYLVGVNAHTRIWGKQRGVLPKR